MLQYAAICCNYLQLPAIREMKRKENKTLQITECLEGSARFEMWRHVISFCNTLQHAATRCNKLQYAATTCNYLQLPAIREIERKENKTLQTTECLEGSARFEMWRHVISILQYAATFCNMLQHAATCYNMLQHAATSCNNDT